MGGNGAFPQPPALITALFALVVLALGTTLSASANGVGTIFVFTTAGTTTILERVGYTVVGSAVVGEGARSVAFSPDSILAYIPSPSRGQLEIIDRNVYDLVAPISAGSSPQGIAVSPSGNRGYVTDSSASALLIIDLEKGGVQARYPLDGPGDGVAVTPDDRRVFVAIPSSSTVASIDPQSGQTVSRIAVGPGATRLVLTPDGGWLYVLRPEAGSIAVIDSRTEEVTTTVSVGPGTTDMAMTPDSRQALVAGAAPNQLTVIDVGPHRIASRGPSGGLCNSEGFCAPGPATGVAADAGAIYLTTPDDNHLWVLDRAAEKVVKDITIAGATAVATVPEPFTIRVIPKELPNTGSGPGGLYPIAWIVPGLLAAFVLALAGLRLRSRGEGAVFPPPRTGEGEGGGDPPSRDELRIYASKH